MTRLFDFRRAQSPARSKTMGGRATMEPAPDAARAEVAAIMAKIEKTERCDNAGQSGKATMAGLAAKQDRRHRRRVKISAPVRIRQADAFAGNEYDLTMTIDVSREGVLFETSRQTYAVGQEVAIIFPYTPGTREPGIEQRGQVVRVARASEKRFGIAVAFLEGTAGYEIVDSQGRPLGRPPAVEKTPDARNQRPLILIVDEDPRVRLLLRTQLETHGYAVETVSDPSMAVTIMRHRSPVTLICEAEAFPGAMPGGGEMSGYDLCVIVRRNTKLAQMPVILTTRTGMPSDFATAHALGATVCVAKPYDLERVTNLVYMLAPVGAG
ncbi:MAG: response regulator [Candidatus Acidiferrales bacterium]